jgi:hypothetical protein
MRFYEGALRALAVGLVLGSAFMGFTAGAMFGGTQEWWQDAIASRNASGTMSAINGPYQPGTTISSSIINNRYSDIEAEITNSLDRSGRGGMLAAIRGIDGTVASPALSFTSEPGSGLYRIGAGDLGLAVLGVKISEWTSSAFKPTLQTQNINGLVSAPSYSFTSETNSGLYRNGASDLRMAIAGVGITSWNAVGFGIGIPPVYPLDVQLAVGNTAARFKTASNASPLGVVTTSAVTDLGFNATFNGTWNYEQSATAGVIEYNNSTNSWTFNTAPAGVAGAAATLTERARVSASGLTIGASGTAISASFRGTTSWTPGSILSGNNVSTTITVTGAAAGADCVVTPPGNLALTPLTCFVTLNTCNLMIGNPYSGSITPSSGTYACRVFNP